jgi:hypothetical protein
MSALRRPSLRRPSRKGTSVRREASPAVAARRPGAWGSFRGDASVSCGVGLAVGVISRRRRVFCGVLRDGASAPNRGSVLVAISTRRAPVAWGCFRGDASASCGVGLAVDLRRGPALCGGLCNDATEPYGGWAVVAISSASRVRGNPAETLIGLGSAGRVGGRPSRASRTDPCPTRRPDGASPRCRRSPAGTRPTPSSALRRAAWTPLATKATCQTRPRTLGGSV